MKKAEYCERVSQYRNQLYITAYAILKNEKDAEDAACNAILKGYENLEQLRSPHKLKAWMLTITKNEALKIRQKRMELPGNEVMEQMLPPVYDRHDDLWDIVQNLKEEYRLVIILFYYTGLSLRDISQVLDISVGTVKSRLNRGRGMLKKALGEEKGEEEHHEAI